MDFEQRIPRALRLPKRSLAANSYVAYWATRRWLAEELSPTRIDPLAGLILRALTRNGGLAAMGVIREALSLPPSTAATALRRLEDRGLARRYPNPDDRRVRVAELTDAGRSAAKWVSGAIDAIERDSEEAAGPDVRAGFNAMTNLLAAVPEEADPWA